MKSIIYQEILSVVESITEVPAQLILSHSKLREVVDARCLFFHYLCKKGFTKSQVSRITHHSRQCVTALENGFKIRCEQGGNIMSIFIKKIDSRLEIK